MAATRIDSLREMVAAIGKEQLRYHQFFGQYADRLVEALGAYLGDPTCVALANAFGPFDFETTYRHEGLGFQDDGSYRLPIMVRLKNLSDEGALHVRLLFLAKLENNKLTLKTNGPAPSFRTFTPEDMESACTFIYECLQSLFNKSTWFDQRADYQDSQMGFLPGTNVAIR